MKLTEKQKLFVNEYLIDLNATQAAIRAGYSKKNADKIGSELLGKTRVAEAIHTAQEERAKRTLITADYVLTSLKNVAERCMEAEPVMVKEGNEWVESGVYKFDSSGANKSLELLGKHLKLFTEKVEHSGEITQNVKQDMSKLSVEELKQLETILNKHTNTQ